MAQSKSASVDTVQQARTQARRRLIGAVVLLLVGIIGFPLVFETQPRPIPVDVAIEIPRKDNVAPLQAPGQRTAPAASGSVAPAGTNPARSGEVAAPAATPGTSQPAPPGPSAATGSATAAAAAPSPTPSAAPEAPSARSKPAAQPSSPPVATAPASPAPAAPGVEEPGRFVVQVGAFADASAVQAIRGRAEKLGLKTYTQVAETVAGDRTRVRIGPFATREAAERAAAKAKAGGLSAVVLTL